MTMNDVIDELTKGIKPFGYNFYKTVDDTPGLYSFWICDKCLYVGKSNNLRNRLQQHCIAEDNQTLREYFKTYPSIIKVSFVCIDVHDDELRDIENLIIKQLQPYANRNGKK